MSNFLEYHFAGNAAGTALENAVPETGGPWSRVTGTAGGQLAVSSAGDLYCTDPSNTQTYVAAATPPSPNYRVSATIRKLDESGSPTVFVLGVRATGTPADPSYVAVRNGPSSLWIIYGPPGMMGQITAQLPNGDSGVVDFDVQNNSDGNVALTLSYKGSILLTCTDTSANRVTTAGKVCIQVNGASTDTGGFHIDDVTAGPIPPPTDTVEYLSAAPVANAVALSLGNAQSGGVYSLYRSLDPTAPAASGTLVGSGVSFPHSDPVTDDQTYFYRVVNTVSGLTAQMGGIANISGGPYCTAGHRTIAPPTFGGLRVLGALNLVTMGDSLVQDGANNPTTSQVCATVLAAHSGNPVALANQGAGGTGTVDWQPGTNLYNAAKAAATSLINANPARLLVFLVKLGTNDSTASGNPNGTLSAPTFKSNLKAIIDQLLSDFPAAKIIATPNTYFTPNATLNSYVWDESSLLRVLQYNAAVSDLVTAYANTNAGRVYLGDTYGYARWVADFLTICTPELGARGTLYLHPNQTGSNALGGYWATAVYNAVATSAPVITSPATATATAGVPFFYQIAATNSPTSYGLTGTLPPGLTLNTSTGVISGTPTP